MSGARVVVIGSANVDVTVQVDRIPHPGETVLGSAPLRSGGGKGANQAVAAARAGGAETVFLGSVGDDEDGRLIETLLVEAGVKPIVARSHEAPTGFAFITVSADSENSIVVVPGANDLHANFDTASAAALANAEVLLCQLETPDSLVRRAHASRRSGATLILNAAPARELPADLLSLLDVVVVNEHEARMIAGTQDIDEAIAALRETVEIVIVTLGPEGALVDSAETGRVHVGGHRVRAVDTTAAGDTFCGVLAARLGQGVGLIEAVREANAAAALTVMSRGAQVSIPSLDGVRSFRAALASNPSQLRPRRVP